MEGNRHAIVGIDPGATFGIAIIDLSGRKLSLHSTMDGFSDAARFISAHCTPSLVACDTNPAPEAALRLASYFSCRLFVPRASIREEEKNAIARGSGTRDAHQRDAYCSAVHAYRSHANKLRQIDALAGLLQEEKDRVKHLLLRGYRVQDAFLLLREPEAPPEKAERKEAPARAATADELRARLGELARENANLRLANARLEEEKGSLLQKLRLLENGVRQSVMRDTEYRRLRFQLSQTLQRLSQKGKRRQGQVQKQQGHPPARRAENGKEKGNAHGDGEGINKLGSQELDLEGLVREYRNQRKLI